LRLARTLFAARDAGPAARRSLRYPLGVGDRRAGDAYQLGAGLDAHRFLGYFPQLSQRVGKMSAGLALGQSVADN